MEKKFLQIGIQGYKGSFNEQACRLYCDDHDIKDYEIRYLYTTEKVLSALSQKSIDFGIFGITNNRSGIIMESLEAMSAYVFQVIDVFDMPMEFSILAKKGVTMDKIKTITSHPSIIDTCFDELEKLYPDKQILQGSGILIDQSALAEHLAEPGSPSDVAVIAPLSCAQIYSLDVLVKKIDGVENNTTFVWCKSR